MKLLLAALLLVVCVFPSFAQRGEVEAYAGLPFMYESLNHDGKEKLSAVMPSFSFGLGYSHYGFLGYDKLGLFFAAQVVFPKELKHQLETDRFDWNAKGPYPALQGVIKGADPETYTLPKQHTPSL
jgi:hypothetical protein